MIRIAITGPESSGKTTLCKSLSEYYKVDCIPEFARNYLEKSKGKYNQSDLDSIGKGQLEAVELSDADVVVCDSDFSVLEIWSQYKFNNVSEYLNSLVEKEIFDLHILCAPDIPWEEDPLRENPDNRDELFELYLLSLKKHGKNFIVVSGTHTERVKKSLNSIDLL